MPLRTVRLACNSCGTSRQAKPGVPIEVLRSRLVEVGWYVDETQDLDLCPLHAEAYVEEVL
jgi:hypothetical protein